MGASKAGPGSPPIPSPQPGAGQLAWALQAAPAPGTWHLSGDGNMTGHQLVGWVPVSVPALCKAAGQWLKWGTRAEATAEGRSRGWGGLTAVSFSAPGGSPLSSWDGELLGCDEQIIEQHTLGGTEEDVNYTGMCMCVMLHLRRLWGSPLIIAISLFLFLLI